MEEAARCQTAPWLPVLVQSTCSPDSPASFTFRARVPTRPKFPCLCCTCKHSEGCQPGSVTQHSCSFTLKKSLRMPPSFTESTLEGHGASDQRRPLTSADERRPVHGSSSQKTATQLRKAAGSRARASFGQPCLAAEPSAQDGAKAAKRGGATTAPSQVDFFSSAGLEQPDRHRNPPTCPC